MAATVFLLPGSSGVLLLPGADDATPPPDGPEPPAGATWRVGFGAPFYTDSGKMALATADGDLVHTADDAIGAYDLVQATAGNRPILDLFAFADHPAILCQSWRSALLVPGASPAPVDPQSCTIAAVFRPMAPATYDGSAIQVGVGVTSGGAGYFYENDSYPTPFWRVTSPSGGDSPEQPAVTPGPIALVIVGTPESYVVRVNGVQILSAIPSGITSATGFSLGGAAVPGYASYTAFLGAMEYPTAFSGTDLADLETFLMSFANGPGFPADIPLILTAGDSLTAGVAAVTSEENTWPQLMLDALADGAALKRGFANLAIGGTRSEDWLAHGPTWIDQYYDAARPDNVLLYWAGANSIGAGTKAEIATFCAARKAVGWTVVCLDVIAGWDSPTVESARQTHNAALAADFPTAVATRIRSGAAYADYLIQVGSDPDIGAPGAELDTTFFSPDKVHLKDAGQAIVAGYATAVMNLLGYA